MSFISPCLYYIYFNEIRKSKQFDINLSLIIYVAGEITEITSAYLSKIVVI